MMVRLRRLVERSAHHGWFLQLDTASRRRRRDPPAIHPASAECDIGKLFDPADDSVASLTRPFRLGLALQADGSVAEVRVLDAQTDTLAGTFAQEIRQAQPSFFYPPPTGDVQVEMRIEFVRPSPIRV
jgi:hypothetical protein